MSSHTGIGTSSGIRIDPSDAVRRRELAGFLKAMRDRMLPGELGLETGPRRRAPGLLREEVAQAAGISATWYTWLEQARDVRPSPTVLHGLSGALRLDAFETAHLWRLARPDLHPDMGQQVPEVMSEQLRAVLHSLAPHPAYAINSWWDVLDWNEPAAFLLGDFGAPADPSRNLLRRLLVDETWRALFVDWEKIVRSAVPQFRGSASVLVGEPRFDEFIVALQNASPLFAELWVSPIVQQPPVWRKTLEHPRAGRMTFDFATFQPDGSETGTRFTIYTPSDAATAQKLSFCRD